MNTKTTSIFILTFLISFQIVSTEIDFFAIETGVGINSLSFSNYDPGLLKLGGNLELNNSTNFEFICYGKDLLNTNFLFCSYNYEFLHRTGIWQPFLGLGILGGINQFSSLSLFMNFNLLNFEFPINNEYFIVSILKSRISTHVNFFDLITFGLKIKYE